MSLVDVSLRVGEACRRAGRDPAGVTVVAVSKGRSVGDIVGLHSQGHRDFGENRAEELAGKVPRLPSEIRWHFVGRLQSRQARLVRPAAHLLHSLDRDSLAKAWLKGIGVPPPALLQVNIAREPQKGGLDPEDAVERGLRYADMGVPLAGVMAIPPQVDDPEEVRDHFRRLTEIGDALGEAVPGATEVSMGMTDDFEVAVEEGASIIRVGRAIFVDHTD